MMNPILWIALAVNALMQAGGLPAAPAVVTPAADDLASRQALWSAERIQDMDADGLALRQDGPLSNESQRRVYLESGAKNAESLWREGRGADAWGTFALLAFPALGAGVGGVIGNEIDTQRRMDDQAADRSTDDANPNRYALIGAAGGAVLGLMVGGVVDCVEGDTARRRREAAAEAYNRHLLKKLRLGAAPIKGGAVLGLNGSF